MAIKLQQNQVLDALGSEVRRSLLDQLADHPQNVNTLSKQYAISRPAISRHLAQLEDAGLVTRSSIGTQNVYSINPDGFEQARQWLNRFWDDAEQRIRLVAENTWTEDHDE